VSSGSYAGAVADADPTRDELVAAVAARRELGPEYEDAVAESFLAKVEDAIRARVDAQVAERLAAGTAPESSGGGGTLGVWSLVLAIPASAIASGNAGLGGLAVTWAGIAIVNLAHALRRRRA
jgi:hypothetical protein